MIRIAICLDLLVLFGGSLYGQEMNLKTPNVPYIQEQLVNTEYENDAVYYYLINNYKAISTFYEKEGLDDQPEYRNAFIQKFEGDITYKSSGYDDEPGVLSVDFPKMNLTKIRQWIEQIHQVYEGEEDSNMWNEDLMIYMPENEGAGCYYEIIETDKNCSIRIYCGC